MEFRKEKNLIYLTVENQQYIYNIATNQLVNTKRPKRTLTTVDRFLCFHYSKFNSLLAQSIGTMAYEHHNWIQNNYHYQTLCLIEKIENICSSHNISIRATSFGGCILNYFHDLQKNTALFNYFISQIIQYANQSIDFFNVFANISRNYKYTQYKKLWEDIDLSMFNETEQKDIMDKFIRLYANNSVFQHEQKDEYFSVYKYYYSKFIIPTLLATNIREVINIKDIVIQYLELCRKMKKTPQKTTNLLRE